MSYNPNQPRDPKGEPTGGQWTADGSVAGNAARKAAGLDDKSEGVNKQTASYELAGTLNNEWNKTHKEEFGGPFWDTQGEQNPRYYTVRDNRGKLIGGATTVQYGVGTHILSIGSAQKGAGSQMISEMKRTNIFLFALSSSPKASAWYERRGFVKDVDHPNHYNYVWKRVNK
jgi:hypothetical protein